MYADFLFYNLAIYYLSGRIDLSNNVVNNEPINLSGSNLNDPTSELYRSYEQAVEQAVSS